MNKLANKNINLDNKLIHLLKGVIIAYVLTFVSFVILASLLTYTSFSENNVPFVIIGVTIFSVFVAGLFVSAKVNEKGWIWGTLVGLGYYLLVFTITAVVNKSYRFDLHTITFMIMIIAAGLLGGIVGINMKK